MESLGLQNDRFGYSKSHQSHQPASPTIYQLHCNRLPRGRRQGATPLGFAAPLKGEQGVMQTKNLILKSLKNLKVQTDPASAAGPSKKHI